MKKMKVLALVLAAIMVLALLPAISFADSDPEYYLIGTINGWDTTNHDYPLTKLKDNEYMIEVDLPANAEIKVISADGNTWYPGGSNYPITNAGKYFITFDPRGNRPAPWHEGCFVVWGQANAPYVAGHTLSLGDEIGVNFYVDSNNWGLNNGGDNQAIMEFTIYDKDNNPVQYKEYRYNNDMWTEFKVGNDTVSYLGFTCFINVAQMAQTIKAELRWADGSKGVLFTEYYSAEQYFTEVKNAGYLAWDYNGIKLKEKNLIIATWNYGVKMQKFLKSMNGLPQYTMMTTENDVPTSYFGTLQHSDLHYYIPTQEQGGIVKDGQWENVFTETKFQLILDYKTTIKVYLTPSLTGYTLKYGDNVLAVGTTVELDESHKVITTQGNDGRIVVEFTGIMAHELITPRTLSMTYTEGETNYTGTATFYGISYARSMMNNANNRTVWTDAAEALIEFAVYSAAYNDTDTYYVNYQD